MGPAVRDLIWISNLLIELGFSNTSTTRPTLFVDNEAAIKIGTYPGSSRSTRHLIQEHFVRDYVRQGRIDLKWIATKQQIADIMTKALSRILFESLRTNLGVEGSVGTNRHQDTSEHAAHPSMTQTVAHSSLSEPNNKVEPQHNKQIHNTTSRATPSSYKDLHLE
jgi:hypothetical protein